MKRAVPFIVLISLSSASTAQLWVPFADCGGGDQLRSYSYDRSSVVTEGANRVVRIKGDYSRVRGSRTSEGRILWTVNCGDRTFMEKSRTEFRTDGTLVSNYDSPTGQMLISADSVADKLSREVCVSHGNRS